MLINVTKRIRSFCDQLRMYSLNITVIAVVLLIFVFLGVTNYLYLRSDALIDTQKAHSEYFEQKATGSGWMQINKQKSNPLAVIKVEEDTHSIFDKQVHK
jgi:hypothetical protein